MHIPIWLTLGVAALVIFFGAYRIRIALRSDEDNAKRPTLFGRSSMRGRTHLLIGIVYVLLGVGLVATALGWNPFGNLIGPSTEKSTKDTGPTKGGIPVDPLPPQKK